MSRLIQIWLVLFTANLFAVATIGVLAFQVIDLRFEVFAQVILVPWAQAVAVWWLLGERRAVSLAGSLRQVVREQPALALFFLADAIILASSWGWHSVSAEAVSRDWRMATIYVGLKGVIAGFLVLGFLLPTRRLLVRQAGWTAAFGVALLAYGSTCLFDWLKVFPDLVFPGLPLLYRWLAFYGSLFAASLLVLLRTESMWRNRSPVAARMLEVAPALLLVSATAIVLGLFNNPTPPPVLDQVARSFSLLAVSALWTGVWHHRKETAAATAAGM